MIVAMRRWLGLIGCLAIASAPAFAGTGWITPAAGPTRTGDPEIVLTFDDGPNPQTTIKVLDTLKQHELHAIFFLVGDRLAADKPAGRELVGRMIREGHIVANHTVDHLQLCGVPEEIAAAQIDRADQVIHELAGMPVPWFRSPYGAFCLRLEAQLGARHLTHMYWDIDSQEWKHNNAKRAYGYIVKKLSRLQGREVLLMHDTKVATAKALPQILDWIAAENAKRAGETRRQIRIIEPWEIAAEQVAPGLIDWLGEAAEAGLDTVASAARCLP